MANPEHLAILRQGVKRWNNWRQQYPEMHPDLSEARLEGADLRDADLSETFLVDADLNHANLSGANLRKAGLPSANLGGANLQQASLEGAELTYANLTTANLRNADLYAASLQLTMVSGTILVGANLRGAKFRGTHFAGAHLAGSDFTNAVARSAIFSDVDLSTVSGLGEMFHEGPSTIGIDTIYKSHGQIPKVFLRGCGLADWEIEAAKLYDPSLSAADAKDIASRVLLIWLLQQAPIGSTQPLRSELSKGAKSAVPLADRAIGNLKQWLIGTYHGVSRAQLQVYLDEFVFRHNRRKQPAASFQTLLGLGTVRKSTEYLSIRGARDLAE